MLPQQQGYDRAITVFSPDGRLYQVEYAIETVRRGTIAVGVKCKDGIVIAVEEKPRKLQISETAQKIFQVDDHVGVAAAGYIPDARSQVDNARFFSQSNKMIYDEPVEVETIAKHLADQCQQFTQYAGVRPFGVSLILGGVVNKESQLYLTDPSGTEILSGLKFAKNRWSAKDAGTLKVGRKSIIQKEVHSVTTEQAQWRLKNWKMMIANYRRRGYSYPTISRIKKILVQKSKKKSK